MTSVGFQAAQRSVACSSQGFAGQVAKSRLMVFANARSAALGCDVSNYMRCNIGPRKPLCTCSFHVLRALAGPENDEVVINNGVMSLGVNSKTLVYVPRGAQRFDSKFGNCDSSAQQCAFLPAQCVQRAPLVRSSTISLATESAPDSSGDIERRIRTPWNLRQFCGQK